MISVNEVSRCVAMNPSLLKPVAVGRIPDDIFQSLAEPEAGKCYLNAVLAARELEAEAVVFGCAYLAHFGLAVEHAWIVFNDGEHFDPTYQEIMSEPEFNSTHFYELLRVPLAEYVELSQRINPSDKTLVIGMMDLRRWDEYADCFGRYSSLKGVA